MTKWTREMPVTGRESQEELSYMRFSAKRKLIEKLTEELHNGQWWAIRINEKRPTRDEIEYYRHHGVNAGAPRPSYKLRLDISRVETMDVPPVSYYSSMSAFELSQTALGEIKRRILRKFKQ